MLPFKIKFTKHLKTPIHPGEESGAMSVVKEVMKRVGAEEIALNGNDLIFTHNIFGKFSLDSLSGLNAGKIHIQVDPANSSISYEFNTSHLHIFIGIFSLAGFFIAPKIWMACLSLGLLVGINLLILCFRQRLLFNDIIKAIHYPEILTEPPGNTGFRREK
jgi:hypothetical protein